MPVTNPDGSCPVHPELQAVECPCARAHHLRLITEARGCSLVIELQAGDLASRLDLFTDDELVVMVWPASGSFGIRSASYDLDAEDYGPVHVTVACLVNGTIGLEINRVDKHPMSWPPEPGIEYELLLEAGDCTEACVFERVR